MDSQAVEQWYSSSVFHGNKDGRQAGFPTINLDPASIPSTTQQGVYAAIVKIDDQEHAGALYFGPRTMRNETTKVLEIFLLNFNKEIYGEVVQFRLLQFIRPVVHFASLEETKAQIENDIAEIKKLTRKLS